MGELVQVAIKIIGALLTCGAQCCMNIDTVETIKKQEQRQLQNDIHIEDNGRRIDIKITVPVKRKDTPRPRDIEEMEEISLYD